MKKLHEMGNFAQSVLFTLPAAAAVGVVYGLAYTTLYPIEKNIQGEIIALDGNDGCAADDENCVRIIDEFHLQVGDQVYEVGLRQSFQANADNPPYEVGMRVRTTYRSTRDKEFFGADDPVRHVREYDTIVLEP